MLLNKENHNNLLAVFFMLLSYSYFVTHFNQRITTNLILFNLCI